jgi:Ca2+:H+ antiporter
MDIQLDPAQQHRVSIYHRLLPHTLHKQSSRKPSLANIADQSLETRDQTPLPRSQDNLPTVNVSGPSSITNSQPVLMPSQSGRRVSYANPSVANTTAITPLLESVDHAIKDTGIQSLNLGPTMTQDDFTRAVAVATVSALRHQQTQSHSPARPRNSAEIEPTAGGHGGHEGPSWSRTTSASVLLVCTALYAAIAGMTFVAL